MRSHPLTMLALAVLSGTVLFAQQATQSPPAAATPQAARRPASPPRHCCHAGGGQWSKATPDAAEPAHRRQVD